MVKNIFLLLVVAIMPRIACSQMLEFHSVNKLPPAINSVGEESLPLLSPDGKELFFARALYAGNFGGKFSGLDAWSSEARADQWKNPTNTLPAGVNNEGHNVIVGISRDGAKRYFMSVSSHEKMNGIYVTTRINNYWTRPEFIRIPGIDNRKFLGVFVSPDFDVIIFSMQGPDSHGEEDLYFSVKGSTGDWSAPKNMGTTINTKGFEISPFLSSDKNRLYFSSNGHGGEGDADIFFSERLHNSWETWSIPVNLGKGINSKKFDAYFSIYGDSTAYFASNREGKYADIFQVKVKKARTVLASDQRYLSREEWNRELGGTVSNEVVFPSQKSALSPSQQELLFYVANKLQLQKDILFHLVVKEEESPKLSPDRLQAITDHLVQSGIGEDRIIVEQTEPILESSQGKIEIRLIE